MKRRIKTTGILVVVLFLFDIQFPTVGEVNRTKNKEKIKSLHREISDGFLEKWVEQDVAYIITEEEKAAFSRLGTDEERYSFIEQFWIRRDPSPDTIENEYKEEHYRRIAFANVHFSSGKPGWKTDRGRVYITWGPPDQIESHPSGGTSQRPAGEGGGTTQTFPFEVWRYRYLEGEELGNNVELEFVDSSMSNEYRLTMDASDKDALKMVPNAGLTELETMNLAKKEDRFNPASDPRQFEKLGTYAYIMGRAPKVKFKDLEAIVDTKVNFKLLPFDFRFDFVKITDTTVMTPITLQVENRDLTFQNREGIQRAVVNIFGRITTITGRRVQVFEDVVSVDVPDSLFPETLEKRSFYQIQLPLPSGLYRLELVLKDIQSGNTGTIYKGFTVPKFPEDRLSTSSIILANKIDRISSRQLSTGQFMLGGAKVVPNAQEPPAFARGSTVGIWFQIYHLTLDTQTHHPLARIDFVLKAGPNEISRFSEDKQDLVGASSQMTIEKLFPLQELLPGKYCLTVTVTDRLANSQVSQMAPFLIR